MKKQILLAVIGVSILPVSVMEAQAADGFDMGFCDQVVMNNMPTYNTSCDDADSYDSHMAEFKGRSLQAVMRYVWKTAKRKDRKSRFADAYADRYSDVYAQYDDKAARGSQSKNSVKDVKEVAGSFFKDASYGLRLNRKRFLMKLKVKF